MLRSVLLGTFLAAFSSGALLAQGSGPAGTSDQQKACRNDVVKLCRGLEQAGNMEIYQCLLANRQKLSRRCREALEEGR